MTSEQQDPSPAPADAAPAAPANQAASQSPSVAAAEAPPVAAEQSPRPAPPVRPRIKIGTQREGVAAPRIPPRVATVFHTPDPDAPPSAAVPSAAVAAAPGVIARPVAPPPAVSSETAEASPIAEQAAAESPSPQAESLPADAQQPDLTPKPMQLMPGKSVRKIERMQPPGVKVAMPNLRAELPPELAEELEASLGGMSIDQLIESEPKTLTTNAQLEPESRVRGKVIHVHRDSVFIDLGGPNQGVLPLRQFAEPPPLGMVVEGVVVRFNAEEGLFELTVPGGAVDVGDWSQVAEGMIVEANITGHNKGGLECDVNKLRGFIPMSQIAPYRVDMPEQFVGQKLVCLVTEVDADRRKLVLSRRSMIEREQAEAKEKMLAELAVGQIHEGTVRSLRDFGAFVDIGGVDGLLHVSQISWDRLKHPSEALKEGQKIRVKIDKIHPDTHKISLSHRDLLESPWKTAAAKYSATSRVKGTVSKLTEFGAFVRLEAGVEGLIHISELAHTRVFRASDIVSEGQEVEVKVLSVDTDAQRISLSLKALQARPEPKKKEPEPEEEAPPPPPPSKRSTPLKGGLGRGTGGDSVGLKW
jgi:predicted RNA-binding protein with RPS1 domain